MQIIDEQTVILTDVEEWAEQKFYEYQGCGYGIPLSAQLAANRTIREFGIHAMQLVEFVKWISGDTVARRANRFNIKPEWRK